MLPWPDRLPPPRSSTPRTHVMSRDADGRERAAAEAMVRDACAAAGLVPVHVRVALARRPSRDSAEPPENRPLTHWLAVTIIGRRWVHATGRPKPLRMWSREAREA